MPVQHFYDAQVRRFLLQFTRIFSGFQVEYGRDDTGAITYMTVPVKYADASRQAQTIIQNNSANSMPCAPQITFYISGMEYARDRVQDPYFVDRKHVRQRTYDEGSQTYEETQGNAFTVERVMPVPYNMKLTVDIWTSNTHQKLQLFEQISTMFNPSLEIQSTDNYLDWTSLSVVELNDMTFSSKQIPVGDDDPIDTMSYRFTLPIWVTPPAKVFKGGIIHKVITSMYDSDGDLYNSLFKEDLLLGTRLIVTPHGFRIFLLDNYIQIVPESAVGEWETSFNGINFNDDVTLKWLPVIEEYGTLRDGISQIRINNENTGEEIIGTVQYHPTDENKLIFNIDVDTLPANTIDPVDAIIDPTRSGPGAGLLSATAGQRYLLTDDIGHELDGGAAQAWVGAGNEELIAEANDIVQYDGNVWNVVFKATPERNGNYVTNVTTGLQYKWTGESWIRSYEGLYAGGEWSVVI